MSIKQNHTNASQSSNGVPRVGIIGGGTAGSTIAIRLAALGVETFLFENKSSLIDGPPMCHLHAGGNLYREIPDEDCIALLKQSIDTLRLYPYSIDVRPTVIAVPKRDSGDPTDLLPRLKLLTKVYTDLTAQDPANKVLGEPNEYYHLYSRSELEALAKKGLANEASTTKEATTDYNPSNGASAKNTDDWVAAAAKQLDLDKLKFPVVAVMEYGWNIFRLAASAQRALSQYPNAHVMLDTKVISVTETESDIKSKEKSGHHTDSKDSNIVSWQISYLNKNSFDSSSSNEKTQPTSKASVIEENQPTTIEVDYLINACGFRTGNIDDMVGIVADRMVEFKASYITHWEPVDATVASNTVASNTVTSSNMTDRGKGQLKPPQLKLPEIIIHGTRGTPHGMVQLTPYPEGYYQIHNMSKAVTLFEDGLVSSSSDSSQPKLKPNYINYIDKGWDKNILHERSQRAIEQVSEFVPKFASAYPVGNALYGGQQIPGDDDILRVADVSLYPEKRYARAENVKASSALLAADEIVQHFYDQGLLAKDETQEQARLHHDWAYLHTTNKADIDKSAQQLTELRHFPQAMSGVVTPYYPSV